MQHIDLTQPPKQAMTLLLYGPPGVGKSTVCAWLARAAEADKKPAVLMDTERGLLPAAMASELKDSQLLAASGAGSALEILRKCQEILANPEGGLVVLDTVTEVSEAILRDLSGETGPVQIQAYGEQKNRLARIVRGLRDLAGAGVVSVATAQQDAQDIEGLPGRWHPSVRKALVTDLVSQFDCVAMLRTVAEHEAEALNLEAGCRYLDFRPTTQQVAKCRTAGELFPNRPTQWHLWPMRNAEDAANLYKTLSRNSAAQKGAQNV
jgi:DNA polymerase III delta prime subunit